MRDVVHEVECPARWHGACGCGAQPPSVRPSERQAARAARRSRRPRSERGPASLAERAEQWCQDWGR